MPQSCCKGSTCSNNEDIVRALESDFKENKDSKMTSQEDLQFLKIIQENIEKTEDGLYEMPLPFKKRPLLPDNRTTAVTDLSS